MKDTDLNQIAVTLSNPPKGILAADESTNTITKRFSDVNIDSSFENRRKYRELLFKTKELNKFVSGVGFGFFENNTVLDPINKGPKN